MNIEEIKHLYLDEKQSIQQIANKLGASFWSIYGFMKKNDISRRNPSEINYLKSDRYKPRFILKEELDDDYEKLKIAALMLYWAEGAKNGDTVDFANSDPKMIKIFLRFLREICGVAESRFRVYLYAFDNQNIVALKKYWSTITKVPLVQFTKPYIRKVFDKQKNQKMPFGMIHIRYNDKRLFSVIKTWLRQYKDYFNRGEMPE